MVRKINKNTTELVSARSLGKQLGMSNTFVEGVVKRSKLKPVQLVPYATGVMRLYLRSDLQPLVEQYVAELAPKPAADTPPASTPACPSSDPCMAELAKHLAINDATLDGLRETVTSLSQQVGLLLQQNRELFGVLKAVQGDTSALAAGLIGAGAA